MSTESIKTEARRLVDGLPDDASWDDLMQLIYVRQAIESGLKDAREGRMLDVKEIRERFGCDRIRLKAYPGHNSLTKRS